MEVFLVWLILSFAIGYGASARGRSGVAWVLISLLISPVIAFVALILTPALDNKEDEEEIANDRQRAKTLRQAFYSEMNSQLWDQKSLADRIRYLKELGHTDPTLAASRKFDEVPF